MCSGLDFACQAAEFFAPIIFWAKIAFYCVMGVLLAAVLLWSYRRAGWWGVGIALSFGAAGFIYSKGVEFGSKWHEEPPKERPKPIAPKLDELLKDIFNGNRKR